MISIGPLNITPDMARNKVGTKHHRADTKVYGEGTLLRRRFVRP